MTRPWEEEQASLQAIIDRLTLENGELRHTLARLEARGDGLLNATQDEQGQADMAVRVAGIHQQTLVLQNRIQLLQAGMVRLLPQPVLTYFVLNILDHCNLRCRGCDHFAAIAEKRFVGPDRIEKDLQRMAVLLNGTLIRMGIMGGEPLLHPELKTILQSAATHFPHTLLQLVTNGILLLQQDADFWRVCRENKIHITVTRYPLALDYAAMKQRAAENQVVFEFYGNTGTTEKSSHKIVMDIDGRQDPRKSFLGCYHANSLPLLMEGRFYPCTVMPNVRHFNRRFGTGMETTSGDFLEIDHVQDAEAIFHFLSRPKPFCRYCFVTRRTAGHPWARSEQEMSEWV